MGIYIGQNKIGMVGSSSTSQVENGTLGTPTINDSGLIVTKVEKSGYLNAGASTSLQLNIQEGTTINPSTSEQDAVPAKVYTTGVVKIGAIQTETLEVSQNGTYTPSEGKWFSSVTVDIPDAPVEEFNLQEKTVDPALRQVDVLPDTGFDGLSRVTINAIHTATQATPTISINEENGEITATSTQSAGWVAAGTTTQTEQLSTQSGTTIIPTKGEQKVVEAHTYTLGDIKVGAIPSNYIEPSGTINITTNDTYDVTNYATAIVEVPSSGGSSGSSAPTIKTLTLIPSSDSSTLSFSTLDSEPRFFSVTPTDDIALSTTRYITGIEYNGTTLITSYGYGTSSWLSSYSVYYDTSNVSQSYSNGTLTLTSASASSTGYFKSGVEYQLTYIY